MLYQEVSDCDGPKRRGVSWSFSAQSILSLRRNRRHNGLGGPEDYDRNSPW